MHRELKIKGTIWIDGINLGERKIMEILEPFDFHELDIEAVLEENQRARIDSYEDYVFITLHFPKYNQLQKIYELNEFDIFLGRNFLITFRDFQAKHIDALFEKYQRREDDDPYDIDVSPGLILYEIIQEMLEKMYRVGDNVKRDLRLIERQVFKKTSSPLVRDILIKKRNIVVLKHMFQPQVAVLKLLEFHMKKLFNEEIEAYFEDLEDKLHYIISDITVMEEQIESIEDAFKSLVDIQTNSTITLLTLFSAFLLPFTLVTSFYGMNIKLPFQDNHIIVYEFLIFLFVVFSAIFLFFWRRK